MLVNDILTLARTTTHTTTTQFPDATIISWLNLVYKKLIRKIMTEADENYFTTFKELDAVANQSSYGLETNFAQLKSVKVKPNGTTTDYVVSREIDFSVQDFDYEYYALNQPVNEYRHQIIGTNMWLAPRFVAATTGSSGNKQIYYTYEQTQTDLAVGGAESTIAVPLDFQYVLVLGLKPYIYSALGKLNEKNDANAEFNYEVGEMLYLIRGRDDTANNLSTPNDSFLQ